MRSRSCWAEWKERTRDLNQRDAHEESVRVSKKKIVKGKDKTSSLNVNDIVKNIHECSTAAAAGDFCIVTLVVEFVGFRD